MLEKFIVKEKFDLIHLHNLHGYYLNLDFINFLKKIDVPVVWTLHNGWPITSGVLTSFKNYKILKGINYENTLYCSKSIS